MVQVALVPHEAPLHPANNEAASAVAVSVIVLPIPPTVAVQSAPQLISPLSVATLPPPGPPKKTETEAGASGGGGRSGGLFFCALAASGNVIVNAARPAKN